MRGVTYIRRNPFRFSINEGGWGFVLSHGMEFGEGNDTYGFCYPLSFLGIHPRWTWRGWFKNLRKV
jgi:hypothetical protein